MVSDDLVKQLRASCGCNIDYTPCLAEEECRVAQEAADRIEALQAQLAKARSALEAGIACTSEHGGAAKFLKIARETLALLDTPTPAPSSDDLAKVEALVKAAEMMVKAYREESDQTITAFYALEDALAAMKGVK
jgi:hypothetical protein